MTVTVREPSRMKRLTLLGIDNVQQLLDADIFLNISIRFNGNEETKWYTLNGSPGIRRDEIKKRIETMTPDQLRFESVESILIDNESQTCLIVMK